MPARTPLFAWVERSLRLARSSSRTGISPDELVERARGARLTRREVLAAGTLTAAGLAFGCSTRPAATQAAAPRRLSADDSVVIVGAGIAGLTAGYRLHQQGIPVKILEAQDRVGGRMWSLPGAFADGQVVELGGELIDTGHQAIRSLAKELGIALDDLSTDDPSLDTDFWFFGGRRRSEAEVVTAFVPVARRIEADLATISGDVTYRTPAGAETLDHTTLEQWITGCEAETWIKELLSLAYTTEYGLETGRQSALNLLLLIEPQAGGGEPFRIFGESDERFRVHEGNEAIPRELARRLGPAIETGNRLEALRELSDGSFVLTVAKGGGSVQVRAPHVVLALPFTLLRQVELDLELPAVKRRAIDELGYGTNAKLMVGFTERVWRTAHRSNGSVFTDLPFQTIWETSRLQAGRAGVLTNFTGGDHGVTIGSGTPEEQAALLVSDLEKLFPGVAAAREGMATARFHWPSFPYTLGSYASYLPGQWTGIAGAEGERVRRLHFAGEHCSLAAQGFMEGGCETGEAVARAILADLGIGIEVARAA